MCGRYYIDEETVIEINNLLEMLEEGLNIDIKHGEIYPTNKVPILIGKNNRIQPMLSTWGFPNFQNKGVIINARSETAFEKPMFRNSLLTGRCLIPASGFFEWNRNKEKYYFTSKDQHTFYFCGLYNMFEEDSRFVILTTSPNNSIAGIHHRMPLILPKVYYEDWLFKDAVTSTLLKETPVLLNRKTDYEQQELNFNL